MALYPCSHPGCPNENHQTPDCPNAPAGRRSDLHARRVDQDAFAAPEPSAKAEPVEDDSFSDEVREETGGSIESLTVRTDDVFGTHLVAQLDGGRGTARVGFETYEDSDEMELYVIGAGENIITQDERDALQDVVGRWAEKQEEESGQVPSDIGTSPSRDKDGQLRGFSYSERYGDADHVNVRGAVDHLSEADDGSGFQFKEAEITYGSSSQDVTVEHDGLRLEYGAKRDRMWVTGYYEDEEVYYAERDDITDGEAAVDFIWDSADEASDGDF